MKKNNIAYIQLTSSYAPAWGYGGPIRIMYDYARGLSEFRDVFVFTSNENHKKDKFIFKEKYFNKVLVKYYSIFRVSLHLHISILSPKVLYDIYLKTKKYDKITLHVCETRSIIVIYALILKLLLGNKIDLMHSAFGMLNDKGTLLHKLYDNLILKHFIANVKYYLSQNSHETESYTLFLQRFNLRTKINCIKLFPLGTNISDIYKSKRSNSIIKLLFVGRINKFKGLDKLIDFFNYSLKKYPNLQLTILGHDDGYLNVLNKDIDGNACIYYKDGIFNKDRFDFYIQHDIFCMFPTIFEETSLASLECMSAGLPLLIEKTCDIPYVDSNSGFVVENYNKEVLLSKLLKIIENYNFYSINARNISEKHFDIKKQLTQLNSFIEG